MSATATPLISICRPKQWPTITTQQLQSSGFPVYGANGKIGFYNEYNHAQPTILITCRGATCGTLNICEPKSYVTGNAMALDDLDSEIYDLKYIYYALLARGVKDTISGTAQPQITRESLARVSLPIPKTIEEQRRIAAILDRADAIRRKRKQAIALTEQLLRSTFLEMFGDPVTNPKAWPVVSIEELCERGANLVDGPFGSSLKPEHYTSDGIRVVRNWNILDDQFDPGEFKYVSVEKFNEISRSEVNANDVLITTKGTVGDICLMPPFQGRSVLSASGTVRLRLPKTLNLAPQFVVAQMITHTFKRYLRSFQAGSAQQYLNLSAIKKMQLIAPPPDAQANYVAFSVAAKQGISRLRDANFAATQLFDALSRRVFAY